jgi:hypothetical protein
MAPSTTQTRGRVAVARPPGGEFDIFWHFYILDTIRDTARIFGRYLHHPPGFRLNGKRRTAIHKAAVPRRIRRGVGDGPIRRALPQLTLNQEERTDDISKFYRGPIGLSEHTT